MKKVQTKRAGMGYSRTRDLLKPFNFCCDPYYQDPETRYNMRIPPLVTSLTNIAPNNKEGPDLKFRLQDIGKTAAPTFRGGTHKVKSLTQMSSRGNRGRGPLQWYVEDEIALARNIIANEKEEKRKREKQMKRDLLRAKKNRKRKKSKVRRKSTKEENPAKSDDIQKEDIDKEEET